ncbi:MBL fold metallo-hydrolase [Spirochaeta dissipatitropha]
MSIWNTFKGCICHFKENTIHYFTEQLTQTLHAFAVLDDEWETYTNSYILEKESGIIMVDCGKKQHYPILSEAMNKAGFRPEDISIILATHGHFDHAGAAVLFPNAQAYLHHSDIHFIPDEDRSFFSENIVEAGNSVGIDVVHLGHHSPGSCALFDKESKALFCGDHLTFFRSDIPDGQIAGEHEASRTKAIRFVEALADHPRKQRLLRFTPFPLFLSGLLRLLEFPANYYCSGHGPVLHGRIHEFLQKLLAAAETKDL